MYFIENKLTLAYTLLQTGTIAEQNWMLRGKQPKEKKNKWISGEDN